VKGAWNFVFVLVIAGLVMGVLQLALMALIVWGLIMRPRPTIGMLLVLFLLSLIDRAPWIGAVILALLALLAGLQRRTGTMEQRRPLPPPVN
jgi:hypothetical protein